MLGWAKADFHPEQRTQLGNYSDYLLKSHRDPLLVVEAKRLGRTFYLPERFKKRTYQANFLRSHGGQELKEAMQQAAEYCNETGARYAVVTNGWQWIIFRGLGEHPVPWTDFGAIAFADTEILRRDYIDFWNLLAKQHVLAGSLSRKFESKRVPPPEFVGRPNSAIRASVLLPPHERKKDIRIFFEQYFGDIARGAHQSMMDYCFVSDSNLHEYHRELQDLLREKKLQFDECVESNDISDDSLLELVESSSASGANARVVLVVGHVGAGKTTFLHRFFSSSKTTMDMQNLFLTYFRKLAQ
ncbi:MAG: hypothetical protein KC468_23455 [Myxococcales bacterium]|nr:hypothetical protein [Myxococcales bacterium]